MADLLVSEVLKEVFGESHSKVHCVALKEIRLLNFSWLHFKLAKGYADLAALYVRKGDFAQAEVLYQQALDMRAQTLGPTHPDYAQVCSMPYLSH